MFCNVPKTDEGDFARLGPTTITGMTILRVLFVLNHDSGRYRCFGWARQLPPLFLGSSIPQTDAGIWGGLFYFRTDAHTLVGCNLGILYVYICPSLFLFFFFFGDAWDSVLHWWLTGSVAYVVATCLTPIGWEASFPVETFSVSRIFQGKGLLILTFPFLLFPPLAIFLLSFYVWCLQPPTLHISPSVFSVSS